MFTHMNQREKSKPNTTIKSAKSRNTNLIIIKLPGKLSFINLRVIYGPKTANVNY